MSRETLLRWDRRLVCGNCGRRSEGRSLAGDLIATLDGWHCPPGVGCSVLAVEDGTTDTDVEAIA